MSNRWAYTQDDFELIINYYLSFGLSNENNHDSYSSRVFDNLNTEIEGLYKVVRAYKRDTNLDRSGGKRQARFYIACPNNVATYLEEGFLGLASFREGSRLSVRDGDDYIYCIVDSISPLASEDIPTELRLGDQFGECNLGLYVLDLYSFYIKGSE